mmetsp:Transcript_32343/g.75069  ORF Transcript_32343/g.75069 Transcript_32343/m.75069 type:complete len:107 (-) Transcript_32343:125-445(-)|eukprot:CAMPEP_0171090582 /NCGR_PEP_ID=MMETSP0766_2-20121228/31947_1 /TAXON_ID=439317 /ORGANISM="Gambierdiscus australes, Strain CAWD 149" /LENGTH=106 /DNA_ID=CAMNT_0011548591 /DNA_START=82 /DNA_END=402 /DNA_ORIENTATION=+
MAIARLLAFATFVGAASPASAACNPALQVCDVSEIEQEMKVASQRGFAFIQAKSSRSTAKKTGQLKENLAAYNSAVKEQVEQLSAKHGAASVSHKRRVVQITAEDD